MRSSLTLLLVVMSLGMALTSVGCTGPNRLRRSVDEYYNESYVKRPLVTQFAFPLFETTGLVAAAVDYTLVNPFYWWGDVQDGQGTPYYYRNPSVPLIDADAEEPES